MREINHYLAQHPLVLQAKGHEGRSWVYAPMILFLLFTLIAGILVGLLSFIVPGTHDPMLWQLNLSFGLVSLMIFSYQRRVEKKGLETLGLEAERPVFEYIQGVILGLVMISLLTLSIVWSGAGSLRSGGGGSWLYWLFLTSGWMIQSFTEELGMRGWFMLKITNRFPPLQSVFFSSLLFAVLHLTNPGVHLIGILNLILCGIFLGLVVFYHGNIYLASGFHFLWNMAQGNLYGFPVSGTPFEHSIFYTSVQGDVRLHGGAFGPEGSLMATALFCVAIFIYYRRLKHRATSQIAVDFNHVTQIG